MGNKFKWLVLALCVTLSSVFTVSASETGIKATYDSLSWGIEFSGAKDKNATYKYIYSVDLEEWDNLSEELASSDNTDFDVWIPYEKGSSKVYVEGISGFGNDVNFTVKVVALNSKGEAISDIQDIELTHVQSFPENTIKLDITEKKTDYNITYTVKATTSKSTDLDSWTLYDGEGQYLQEYAWSDEIGWTSSTSFEFEIYENGTYELEVQSNDGFSKTETLKVSHITKKPPLDLVDLEGNTIDTSNKTLKITYSGVPKSAITGETHTILLKANKQCLIAVEGVVHTVTDISKPVEFKINRNGTYYVSATDGSAKETKIEIKVDTFKDATNAVFADSSTWATRSGTGMGNLPQTGGIAWYVAIILSVGVSVAGVLVLIKTKPSKEEV